MKEVVGFQNGDCHPSAVARYLEGELLPETREEFERHLAACRECHDELNRQKMFLNALDAAFGSDLDVDVPDNFTRTVVAHAESDVRGFRCPRERNQAFIVILTLLGVAALGIGFGFLGDYDPIGRALDQVVTVGTFVGHFVRDVAVASTVVLRSVFQHIMLRSTGSVGLIVIGFGLALFVFSRLVSRARNA